MTCYLFIYLFVYLFRMLPGVILAAVGLLSIITPISSWDVPDNLVETYFGTISQEHSYALADTEGEIPAWIEGYFLRQSCGTFGNQSNTEIGAAITHTFDGLGTVMSFKIGEGLAEFGAK